MYFHICHLIYFFNKSVGQEEQIVLFTFYTQGKRSSKFVSTQPADSQNANSALLTTNFSLCYPVITPQNITRFQMNYVSHRNVTTMCYQVLIGLKAHIPYWSQPHLCLVNPLHATTHICSVSDSVVILYHLVQQFDSSVSLALHSHKGREHF